MRRKNGAKTSIKHTQKNHRTNAVLRYPIMLFNENARMRVIRLSCLIFHTILLFIYDELVKSETLSTKRHTRLFLS